tara:strand:- start:7 stop:480 length:474 start_codon:yes stop_codon:yes gene_type:complete
VTGTRGLTIFFGVAALVGGLVLVTGMAEDGIKLKPDDSALVSVGAGVYRQHCASCHGKNLQGQPNWRQRDLDGLLPAPPHDVSGHTWHHPDEHLFELTKFGMKKFAGPNYRSAMPAYDGTLRDEEIVAVLSYIKSRWPADIRDRHDELNRRYKANRR